MKAKCIKADPLEVLTVGKEYECKEIGRNVAVCGIGFALSRENFEEMFETKSDRSFEERRRYGL